MEKFNIHKHLSCFEGLKLWDDKVKPPHDYYKDNIRKLESIMEVKDRNPSSEKKYTDLLFESLLEITTHHKLDSDTKDELISMKNFNLIVKIVCEACLFGLTLYLPPAVRQHLRLSVPISIEITEVERSPLLQLGCRSLWNIFEQKSLSAHSALDSVHLQLLYVGIHLNEIKLCPTLNREQVLQHLMLLKGFRHSPSVSKRLHRELINQLQTPGGFELLCRLLIKHSETWRVAEIVSKIVTSRGHSDAFYMQILDDCLKFLRVSVLVEDQDQFIPICVTCLKDLRGLVSVDEKLVKWMDELENTLVGAITFTPVEFQSFLQITAACFGGNSVALPSEVVAPYFVPLMTLYSLASDKSSKNALQSILNHILKNSNALETCVEQIFNETETNLGLKYIEGRPSVVVRHRESFDMKFVELLKETGNTLLMYKTLMILLGMFEAEVCNKGDLIDEDELPDFLSKKFRKKLAIIEALQDLIAFKPLHTQFKENPAEILQYVDTLLATQLKRNNNESLQLLLTIIAEIVPDRAALQQILDKHENLPAELKSQVTFTESSSFTDAFALLCHAQPHIKVNGMQQIIELIKRKDPETIANKFKLLAVAIQNLKDIESYTYLNIVRLLVALTTLLEAEVIESLLAEFKTESNAVDYRLKVAEVLVKVVESLGLIVYKYKRELLDCFLAGCLQHTNELRASSFAKLGAICKILTFQVHSFFNEMLTVVQQTLQLDAYLPARRAAVMLLGQLLQGVENILDFQEFLLPLYRTLKDVIRLEEDEVTRMHAALSLETLNSVTKKFLTAEPKINLEIEGVKEKSTIDIKFK